jgi:hypothetical protein
LKIHSQHQNFQPIIGITKGGDNVYYTLSGSSKKKLHPIKRFFSKKSSAKLQWTRILDETEKKDFKANDKLK